MPATLTAPNKNNKNGAYKEIHGQICAQIILLTEHDVSTVWVNFGLFKGVKY